VAVFWNQGVYTERELTSNRSDIIIENKKEETIIIMDVAIPAHRNNTQKKAEKTEIQEFMHSVKTNVVYELYDYAGIRIV
jgi:hypothetical protein